MSQSTRTTTRFRVSQAAVATGLGLANVESWAYQTPHLIAYHLESVQAGPHPQVDRLVRLETLTPWEDIRLAFFSSVGAEKFARMSMTQDTTYLYFDLNLEE